MRAILDTVVTSGTSHARSSILSSLLVPPAAILDTVVTSGTTSPAPSLILSSLLELAVAAWRLLGQSSEGSRRETPRDVDYFRVGIVA